MGSDVSKVVDSINPVTAVKEVVINTEDDVRDIILGGENIIQSGIHEVGDTVRTGITGIQNVIQNTENDLVQLVTHTEDEIVKVVENTENDILELIEHTEDNITRTLQLGLIVGGIVVVMMIKAGSSYASANPEQVGKIVDTAKMAAIA